MKLKEQMQAAIEQYVEGATPTGNLIPYAALSQAALSCATLAAAHYGKDWLPIADAPKDGTEVLGYREDAGIMLISYTSITELFSEQKIKEMEITEDDAEQKDWFYSHYTGGGRLEGSEKPTHFMHLPKPPVP